MLGFSILSIAFSACVGQIPQDNPPIPPALQSTPGSSPGGVPKPLWCFGVSLVRETFSDYDPVEIASMRFGWYVDYVVTEDAPAPFDIEYVPMVRVKQLKQDGSSKTDCCITCGYVVPYEYLVSPGIRQIRIAARKRPGMIWLVGNEMDRVDFGSEECSRQDEMLPELYAKVYHDLYYTIKQADRKARVAIGGMSQFTPLRSRYLVRVWEEYLRLYGRTMPVDIWNIHLYVLQEVKGSYGADIPPGFSETSGAQYNILDNQDFSKAWEQIINLRKWMKDNGQQDKPLIISEYGVTYPAWVDEVCPAYPDTNGCPFSSEQVRDNFMLPSFEAFLNQAEPELGYPADGNRLVHRWNWFSVDYDDGSCDAGVFYEDYNGSLINSGREPSNPPKNCAFPARGLSVLGTYWQQYVQKLP